MSRWLPMRSNCLALWVSFGLLLPLQASADVFVREDAHSALWAVDPWFLDNGDPPFILPLDVWKKGWTPKDCADCLLDAAEKAN
ncbi:MAG: hypothetical protein V1796_03835 [Pseudomonadota bacterium]